MEGVGVSSFFSRVPEICHAGSPTQCFCTGQGLSCAANLTKFPGKVEGLSCELFQLFGLCSRAMEWASSFSEASTGKHRRCAAAQFTASPSWLCACVFGCE